MTLQECLSVLIHMYSLHSAVSNMHTCMYMHTQHMYTNTHNTCTHGDVEKIEQLVNSLAS